ncbi:hypothetical protein MBLNU459_g7189t1 [Dothideomycetes sp. NU459]
MASIQLNIPAGEARPASPGPPGQSKPLPAATKTGTIPFTIPGSSLETETWYALYGKLSSGTIPLICLHGGPGIAHNYILPCSHVSSAPYSRPVILYDQVGCGNSTHLSDKKGDTKFWTPELFMAELDNLKSHFGITTFDLLGQSWGGMLGAQYAITNPPGLRRLIISDSPANMKTWVETANELRKRLPRDVQETLTRCETEGRTDTEEYEKAVMVFYERFVCRVVPFPDEFVASLDQVKKDDTVYLTMNGPSEFFVSGSLKTWDITSNLHKIKVPTLLINGKFDEAQDITMEPYFREITGKVKWVRFAESSHCPMLEETDGFVAAVGNFLESEI